MNKLPARQKGTSAIGTIMILAILGYVAYTGTQYVPQLMESPAIDSILRTVEDTDKTDSISNAEDSKAMVIKLLQVNEMHDLTESLKVKEREGDIFIEFSYDRSLNLLSTVKPMRYEIALWL